MVKTIDNEYLDTVIVGSGLSALNFIDTFTKNKKYVDVISPVEDLHILKKKKHKSRSITTSNEEQRSGSS